MKKSELDLLLYQEELLSRLEIKERSLNNFINEVFENITQVLALVRFRLLSIDDKDQAVQEEMKVSGELIRKAIADLRQLTRQVSPEEVIRNGFLPSLSNQFVGSKKSELNFTVTGTFFSLEATKEILLYSILQKILSFGLENGETCNIQCSVNYKYPLLLIELSAKASADLLKQTESNWEMMKRRLSLIDGQILYLTQQPSSIQITLKQ